MMSNVYTALSQALYFSANVVSSTANQGRLKNSGKASAQLRNMSATSVVGGILMLLAVLNPVSMKAQDFHVISEGNLNFTGSTHVHGALAVGGNLILNTPATPEINMDPVGTYTHPGDPGTAGLLVGGSVTWTNGFARVLNSKYIHIGNSSGSASGDNGNTGSTRVYPTGTNYSNAKRIEGTVDQTPSPALFQTISYNFGAASASYVGS